MAKAAQKASAGGGSGPNLGNLEKLLELLGRHQVAELEWEARGERIVLRTAAAASARQVLAPSQAMVAAPQVVAAPAAAPVTGATAAGPAKPTVSGNQKQVLSPFVGTFYRSARPGADPYVREGSQVKRGDVLCIIEAMKLMNEIESELNGKIVSILVENGQPVEFGEPLFVIEA